MSRWFGMDVRRLVRVAVVFVFVLGAVCVVGGQRASCQLNSNSATGVANGSSAVAMTTSWTGVSLFSSVALYGYFMSWSQALSGGTPVVYIPSSSVLGKVPTGSVTSYTAFTQSTALGTAGAGLQLLLSKCVAKPGWKQDG